MANAYSDMTPSPDTPRNRGDLDAPHVSPVTPAEDFRTVLINRVSWGAVLAGVALSLVTQLILNMLGIGVGAATLDPGTADNPSVAGFSTAAAVWWTVSGIIAALVGGFVAGRLSGRPKESTAGYHGLASWAVATLVIFYLLTSTVGGILGGVLRTVTGAAGAVAQTVGGVAQTAAEAAGPAFAEAADPLATIDQSVRAATGGADPAALGNTAVAALRAAVTGNEQQAQGAREQAAQALAQAQNVPVEQARAQVEQYEQQYRQAIDSAKQAATEAADAAAEVVSRGALFGAIGLLLGAIAAWFGGRRGAVDPTITAAAFGGARRPV